MASLSPQPSPMPPPQAPSPMGPPQISPSAMIPPSQSMVPLHHPQSHSGYPPGPPPGVMTLISGPGGPNGPGGLPPMQNGQQFPQHPTGLMSGTPHLSQQGQVNFRKRQAYFLPFFSCSILVLNNIYESISLSEKLT